MPPKKLAKGKKGKKGRNIKRPEDVDSLAQNMTALSVSGTGNNTSANEEEKTNGNGCERGGAVQRSAKWEHFDSSGRGFKLYTPDGYVTSLEDAHLLIIVDHPIDYGLYDHPRGPCSLGMDALFIEPTLNALIRVLINRMCEDDYNWDVAQCLLMGSVMVSYNVHVSGPVNWIEKHRNNYLSTTNKYMQACINFNRRVISEMKNISGCLIVGEEAFHDTMWLREEFPNLHTNKEMLPPAKDIEKYTPNQRDILLGILGPIAKITPERRQQCLCPDYEVNEKMTHPENYDEKSKKRATESLAQRKLEWLKYESYVVGDEDDVVDEEAPEVD
jgi:hypothetical protein